MPTRHVVAQGECLSSIAHDFGLASWRALYEDPLNADLQKKRPNPNVLFPGDVVMIPDRKPYTVTVPTGETHRFVIKRPEKTRLRVRMLGPDGQPFAKRPYTLDVGGDQRQGTTGDDGLVDEPVPAPTETAKLTVQIDDEDPPSTMDFNLKIGELDPVDEVSGAKARLRNLGFDPGTIDGTLDDQARAAVRAFQQQSGLDPSGALDDATRDALSGAHDQEA